MARTSRKQISIYDEGVLLTDDVDSIDFTGSGVSGSATNDDVSLAFIGSGVTKEIPTGTVNGSNTTFTVSATPKWIVADSNTYFENNGYTLSGLTVTMTSAPWSSIIAII